MAAETTPTDENPADGKRVQSPGGRLMLERLRGMVDLSPYSPSDDAPEWMRDLANVLSDDSGVLVFLSPAGVSVRGDDGRSVRASPDPASLFLAGHVDDMRSSGKRLAVGIPPVSRHFPLLLASSAVLADVLDRADDPNHTTGGVLVVSRDLDLRSRYCDVLVRTEPLDRAHRGSRLKQNGERVMLRTEPRRPGRNQRRQLASQTPDGGVCFFLPRSLPEMIEFSPSLVVLDLRYGQLVRRVGEILEWTAKVAIGSGVVALYSIGDADTFAALAQAEFADFPMDHAAIATCDSQIQPSDASLVSHGGTQDPPHSSVDWSMRQAPGYLSRTHEIHEVLTDESGGIEDWLTVIGSILREHRLQNSPDLNRARWLLSSLTHLAVPIVWYEQAAYDLGRLTMRRMIRVLGVRDQLDPGMGTVMQNLRVAFEEAYKRLEGNHPRAGALRRLLPEIAEPLDRGSLLLLLRDAAMARATRSWLHMEAFPGAAWLNRLDVRSCPEYADLESMRYSSAVINGALPRRYRWVAGAALADRVVFLTYGGETGIVERQLLEFYGRDALLAARQRRERTVRRRCDLTDSIVTSGDPLVPKTSADAERPDTEIPVLELAMPPRRGSHEHQATPPAVTEPQEAYLSGDVAAGDWRITDASTLLAALLDSARRGAEAGHVESTVWDEDAATDEAPDSDLVGEIVNDVDAGVEGIACIRIEVQSTDHGPGWIWLSSDQPVESVRLSVSEEMVLRLPSDLQEGDVLPKIEDGERATLFERIVKLAEEQPEMRYLHAHRRTWAEALRHLADRHTKNGRIRYGDVLADLKSAGAPIDNWLTVRNWIASDTLGPESVASIEAVGRTSGTEILVSDARAFDRSFRRIRGIHQGIGRRLSTAIRAAFRQAAEDGRVGRVADKRPDLEDRLILPLDELLETVDFMRVTRVSGQAENVQPYRARRFYPR